MNVKRISIAAAVAMAAATLPLTAAAHDHWDRGWHGSRPKADARTGCQRRRRSH